MTPEARAKLEELADEYLCRFGPAGMQSNRRFSDMDFMAGAQAAWELATKPTEDGLSAWEIFKYKNTGNHDMPPGEAFLAGFHNGRYSAQNTPLLDKVLSITEDDEGDAGAYMVTIHVGAKSPQSQHGYERMVRDGFLAGRRGLREAVQAAVENERDRIVSVIAKKEYECQLAYNDPRATPDEGVYRKRLEKILNPPKDGAERWRGMKIPHKIDMTFVINVLHKISVLESRIQIQDALLERAKDLIQYLHISSIVHRSMSVGIHKPDSDKDAAKWLSDLENHRKDAGAE